MGSFFAQEVFCIAILGYNLSFITSNGLIITYGFFSSFFMVEYIPVYSCRKEKAIRHCKKCGAEIAEGTRKDSDEKNERDVNMKYCIHCGKEINKKAGFCTYCGKKQEKEKGTEPGSTLRNEGHGGIKAASAFKNGMLLQGHWKVAGVFLVLCAVAATAVIILQVIFHIGSWGQKFDPYQKAALEQIIEQQRASGATVSKRLTKGEYKWDEDGNLIGIYWEGCSLSGGISFSDFPQLEELVCAKNELTRLDITNNTVLERLCCDGNKLEELDVTNNTVLRELYCDNNRLSYLDVTNNTILESLDCGENELTYLDLTYNRNLESVDSIGNEDLDTVDLSEHVWYQHDSWTTLNYDDE